MTAQLALPGVHVDELDRDIAAWTTAGTAPYTVALDITTRWIQRRAALGDWPPRPADRAPRRRRATSSTLPAGTAATPPTRAIGDRDADRGQPAATPTAMGVVEASPPTTTPTGTSG
jgi:hypothetical protein